jgi:hypothetical protein
MTAVDLNVDDDTPNPFIDDSGVQEANPREGPVLDTIAHQIGLHGHCRASRIVLNQGQSGFHWATKEKRRKLKKRFLEEVKHFVQKTEFGDRLLISITGHGTDAEGHVGSVSIGQRSIGVHTWLSPQEFLPLVASCKSEVTLIINSCFSGAWVDEAYRLKLVPPKGCDTVPRIWSGISILAGGKRDEYIHSFSYSGSKKARCGYFMNTLAGKIYEEFGILFPRPTVIPPEVANSPSDETMYVEVFPNHNIGVIVNAKRISWKSLPLLIEHIKNDMRILRGIQSRPTTAPKPSILAATVALGCPLERKFSLRISRVL